MAALGTAGFALADTYERSDVGMPTLHCLHATRTPTGGKLDCELMNDTPDAFVVDVSATGSLVHIVEVMHNGKWQIVDVADASAKAEQYALRPRVAIVFTVSVPATSEPVRVSANLYRSADVAPVVVSSRPLALPGSAGETRTPFVMSSDMVAPQVVRQTRPEYPPMARMARLQGTVVLACVIDTSGRVTEVNVVKGIPLLADAAVNAVRQWRYRPARDAQGRPVPVYFRITTSFKYR